MRLVHRDWAKDFEEDMISEMGFVIDIPISINKKEIIRNPRGLYSSKFGGDITDVEELQRKYICSNACGYSVGKFIEGTICPKCGQKVEYKDDEIEKTGWIVLKEPYYVINPALYALLTKLIKPKILDTIIKYEKKVDKDGHVADYIVDHKIPFANIGLIEFRKRFIEILNIVGDKNKPLEYQLIMENLDKLFINKIAVLSLLLRPVVMLDNSTFKYDMVNNSYAEILSRVDMINNEMYNFMDHLNVQKLYEIQVKLNELYNDIIKSKLNGKKKVFRNMILGSRVNFSARHVIVPLTNNPPIDGVTIPYLSFIEFYKFEIMNIYRKMYNMTITEVLNIWHQKVYSMDSSIVNIINMLITRTRGGLKVLINRPPTLTLGSILCMKIIGVNNDIDDYTMGLPLNILPLMNADFDGDTLTTITIKSTRLGNMLNAYFNPRRMIINPGTGKFNRFMGLIKDQLVGVYSFCND